MEPRDHSCRKGRRLVGDPVDVVTGASTDVTLDFELPGPIPLSWRRYYNSARNSVAGPLGWGHSHEFDRTLRRDLDGLRLVDPYGADVEFPMLEVGEEVARDGFLLRCVAGDLYRIEQAGEPTLEFAFAGRGSVAQLARLRRAGQAIALSYSAEGHLGAIVDSRGRRIRVDTDPSGRILGLFLVDSDLGGKEQTLMAYQYDLAGNLIVGQDSYRYTIRFEYDAHNRMIRRADRRGYSFHFAYDEHGRCVHSRGDDGLLEVHLEYHADLRSTLVRRADGGVWIYSYEEDGALAQIADPCGGVTRFLYDEQGRMVEEVDPNGNSTRLRYDEFGKHDRRIDPLGHELPPIEEESEPDDPLSYELPETPLEWEYGRLLAPGRIGRPGLDNAPLRELPDVIRGTYQGHVAAYDPGSAAASPGRVAAWPMPTAPEEGGRPVEPSRAPLPERWRYDPNANPVEYRDGDGSVYRFSYTSWNLLREESDPLGNATSYEYSPQEQITRVTDPGGTISEYSYDQKDRLVEVRRHGRVRERYLYDKAENVVEKRDGGGRSLVTWEIGAGNLDVVRRLGSGASHRFEYDHRGRITRAETPEGTVTCAFDEDGLRLADRRDGLGVAHEYDLGQLVATTYFDRFRVTYETDDEGDLIITDPTGAGHRVQFGPGGMIVRHLAGGLRELCQFDADGRCRHKAVVRGPNDASPWMRSYTYSAEGDLLAATDTQRGTTRYRHDAAHRLSEEILPDGLRRHYAHDAAGNLIGQPGLDGVVMGPGNRLRAANGDRFSYDDRDHLAARQGPAGEIRYEYDALDMLVRCDLDGQGWAAAYDGFCRRIRKTWLGRTTTYYWDDFRLAAEVRHSGAVRLYLYADEGALVPLMFVEYGDRDAAPESGRRFSIFTDQVGVPIRVEDDAGRIAWSARIDPFGAAHVDPGSTIEMPLRFPGHHHDPETGLHYNRFRYYSPELGRYLQSDPLGIEGGINLYAYPATPLTAADIDGLRCPGAGGGRSPQSYRNGRKGEGSRRNSGGRKSQRLGVQRLAEREARKLRRGNPRARRDGELGSGNPTAVTVVRDRRTGRTYVETSGRPPLEHNQAHPDLNMPRESREPWPPGNCAEPKAINRALNDRARREDLEVATVRVETGQPMPCCRNCRQTTRGTRVATG